MQTNISGIIGDPAPSSRRRLNLDEPIYWRSFFNRSFGSDSIPADASLPDAIGQWLSVEGPPLCALPSFESARR